MCQPAWNREWGDWALAELWEAGRGRGGSVPSTAGCVPRGWAELVGLWSPRQHSIVGPPRCVGHSPAHTAQSPVHTIPADSPHCVCGFAQGNSTPQGHSLLIVVGTYCQHLETCCCHRAGSGTVGLGTVLAEPAVLCIPWSPLTMPGHSHPSTAPGTWDWSRGPFCPCIPIPGCACHLPAREEWGPPEGVRCASTRAGLPSPRGGGGGLCPVPPCPPPRAGSPRLVTSRGESGRVCVSAGTGCSRSAAAGMTLAQGLAV